jgi:hypothetical protein
VLLLTPIFWLTKGSLLLPIRMMLIMATLFHVAGGIAVYRAARLVTDRFAARLALFFFLGNPLVVYVVVSGMESPLVGLLVALLAYESIRLRQGKAHLTRLGDALRLGILCGLTILARTDLVLLVGLVLAGVAFISPTRGRTPIATRLWGVMLAGLFGVLLISPWVVWNLVRFGSLVQVSARAHHLHSLAQKAIDATAGAASAWSLGPSIIRSLFHTIARRTVLPEAFIGFVIALVVGVFAAWIISLVRRSSDRQDFLTRVRWVDAPLLYVAGFLFAAFFILGHIRSWYLAGPLAVGGILTAYPAFYAFGQRAIGRPRRFLSGLVLAGILATAPPLWYLFGGEIVQNARNRHVWSEASEWVVENTSPEDRIASFNSGTFGYLTPRTVVNLDCVINNRAIPWLERRELVEYLRRDHIRYVVDDPGYAQLYFSCYARPDWEESVVAVEDLPAGLRVYSVQ